MNIRIFPRTPAGNLRPAGERAPDGRADRETRLPFVRQGISNRGRGDDRVAAFRPECGRGGRNRGTEDVCTTSHAGGESNVARAGKVVSVLTRCPSTRMVMDRRAPVGLGKVESGLEIPDSRDTSLFPLFRNGVHGRTAGEIRLAHYLEATPCIRHCARREIVACRNAESQGGCRR